MAELRKKKDHRYDAFWRFTTAGLLALIAWMVAGPMNTTWDDDAWWPLFGVVGLLYGLAGVRSLAEYVRERQAAEAGEGTA